jgi:hypothetical protein
MCPLRAGTFLNPLPQILQVSDLGSSNLNKKNILKFKFKV